MLSLKPTKWCIQYVCMVYRCCVYLVSGVWSVYVWCIGVVCGKWCVECVCVVYRCCGVCLCCVFVLCPLASSPHSLRPLPQAALWVAARTPWSAQLAWGCHLVAERGSATGRVFRAEVWAHPLFPPPTPSSTLLLPPPLHPRRPSFSPASPNFSSINGGPS